MDYAELKRRQQWTLHQKIDHSLGAIEAFISQTGRTPFVSYSGGKDSTVLLNLVRRYIDKGMKAVFATPAMNIPKSSGLSAIRKTLPSYDPATPSAKS